MKKTQNEKILSDLLDGRRITPLLALKRYGCMRLGARIHDLRWLGYSISSELVACETADGRIAHVAEYSMP